MTQPLLLHPDLVAIKKLITPQGFMGVLAEARGYLVKLLNLPRTPPDERATAEDCLQELDRLEELASRKVIHPFVTETPITLEPRA